VKHVVFASTALLMFLLGNAAASGINLMDTSGGTALPSPAVSFVAGYPFRPPAKPSIPRRVRPRHAALNSSGQAGVK
jgi:hypothetical protein